MPTERREDRIVGEAAPGRVGLRIPAGRVALDGDLGVPDRAIGVVAFAHGSGSSRLSPRNRHVAIALQGAGLATLLFDLLTADEEEDDRATGRLRFDVELLSTRLTAGVGWLKSAEVTAHLPIGLFGASTGAAAALVVAAREPAGIRAVVSRGGRPDLVGPDDLAAVRAPTLLIVGGRDEVVLGLNRSAAEALTVQHRIVVVPGASHLFEEPGALDAVSRVAAGWFVRWLGGGTN